MTDLVAAAADRLKSRVAALRSVDTALELARLIEAKLLPQRLPAAFVLPQELTADPDDALGGDAHDQILTETIGVVAVDRAGNDRTGGRAAGDLTVLRGAIIAALAGWTPDETEIAPLDFVRASLTGFGAGAGFLHLTFSAQRG